MSGHGRDWRSGPSGSGSGSGSRDWRNDGRRNGDHRAGASGDRDRDRNRDRDWRRGASPEPHKCDRRPYSPPSSQRDRHGSSRDHSDDHRSSNRHGGGGRRGEDGRYGPPAHHEHDDRRERRRSRSPPPRNGHALPPRPPPPPPPQPPAAVPTLDPKQQAEEEEKKRAKREKIEAYKRQKQAEKAAAEAQKAKAQPAASLSTSLPSKGLASINAIALKTIGLSRNTISTTSAMGEAEDLPERKKMEHFELPPMDPTLEPAAAGSGANLEGGDDDDDDEEPMTDAQAPAKATPMDTEEDDEELDPLDAFMAGVSTEVKQVNEQDRKRMGFSAEEIEKGIGRRNGVIVGEDELAGADDKEGNEADEDDELAKLSKMEDILAHAAKSVKKRGVPQTDHSKVDYEPFRKAFYHSPAELEEMTEEDAELLRMELDGIAVRGKDCPKPLTKWSHCGLPASCLDVIKKLGYEKPTPIQAQAIPAIMSGRDTIGVAKTGSGKTMAFLLPMFRHINDQRPVEAMEGPIGLIMTPTRELAVQIYRESKPFLRGLGLRSVCVYGGVPISEQIAEMKKTAEIVVATPGRMIDLLTANSGRVTNLRRVTYLVLDEADRMFDMGFEPQVMNIVNNIRPDRQTVLFSATFPKQMESLARKVLRNKPVEIAVGGKSVVAPEIEQIVEVREQDSKFNRLLEILGQFYESDEDARTLIFVDRQEAADDLLRELMRKGYPTMSIHGGKDQVDRDSTIADFKAGVVPIVTATSIAARGLDVKQLKLVINYDVPNHLEDYVHRAGRTGRAGNKGTCVTFITPQQERYARDIVTALTASKTAVPADLQVLANKFLEKVKNGKAQSAGSGFGGKGLERLESDREKAMQAQKTAFGDQGATDEAGDKGEKEAGKAGETSKVSAKEAAAVNEEVQQLNDMKIEVKKGPAPDAVRDNKTASASEASVAHAAKTQAHMEAALAAAKAGGADTSKLAAALAKIQAMHAEKRAQLNGEGDKQRKTKDPDATDYHAIVPINDFPQKARWKVTNKETMSLLIEDTSASITLKGAFYEKGKEPAPGEPPKLSLLVESNDPERIERAVRDIKLILLEATQQALEAEQRGGSGPGRYNVL